MAIFARISAQPLISSEKLYYLDSIYSVISICDILNDFFNENQNKKIRGLVDMAWILDTIPSIDKLMIYESILNNLTYGKLCLNICLYNLNLFSGTAIMQVLRTHPLIINNRII